MRASGTSALLGKSINLVHANAPKDAMALITVSNKDGEQSVLVTSKGLARVDSQEYVLAPQERKTLITKSNGSSLQRIVNVAGWSLVTALFACVVFLATGLGQARVVLTDSMAPAISPGDVLVTLPTSALTPGVGDVIVYTARMIDGTPKATFSHRIISGDGVKGFVTKGDNNPNPDLTQPVTSDIDGVLWFTIPWLGHLFTLRSLTMLIVGGFGIWLIVDALRDED